VAPGWPVKYKELAPFYDVAEQLMGTHGQAGVDPLEPPRSGPMPYPAIGHEPKVAAIDRKLRKRGLHPFPLPIAIDYHEGGSCARCMTCDGFACKIGAKGDAEIRLVNPALAKGGLTLATGAMVRRLIMDASGRRVVSVEIEHQGQVRTIAGGTFVSSAGAINCEHRVDVGPHSQLAAPPRRL